MARKTIKELEEYINTLEEQLRTLTKYNTEFRNKIAELEENRNNNFKESNLYKQMQKEINKLNLQVKCLSTPATPIIAGNVEELEKLEEENKQLKERNRQLENKIGNLIREKADLRVSKEIEKNHLKIELDSVNKLISEQKQKHNERGAGRKKTITDDVIKLICELRKENKSMRAIAKEVNLSVASVHKIINEQNKK